MNVLLALPLAQRVRLGFAAGCQLLALIFLIVVMAEPASTSYVLADGTSGGMMPGQVITNSSLFGFAIFAFLLQVAVVTLVSITLYRFARPAQPRVVYLPQPAPQPETQPYV
jgi:multisubunit Na+/H+ antiporter MnhB subunit